MIVAGLSRISKPAFGIIMFSSVGILSYVEDERGRQLILLIDQVISDYYRSLLPKYFYVQPQQWPAHITVVRRGLEVVSDLQFWGKHEGEKVEFFYDPVVREGTVYFWLNCFSKRLEEIRLELGLSVKSEYTIPPEPFIKVFHCTIGNKKNV